MSSFHTVCLKKPVFDMLEPAKEEFVRHHREWEIERISNNKIIYEALRYYIESK